MYDRRGWDSGSGESDDDFDIDDLFQRHSHYSSDMGLLKGLVSVVAGVALLALVLYCCCRRRRRRAGRVLTNPPPPPGPNTLPAAAYPRQEYAPQPEAVAPYPHVAVMQTAAYPGVSPYPAAYPAGQVYPPSGPGYPPSGPGYPPAGQGYPAQSYPVAPLPPAPGLVYPTAPSAPEYSALPPSYDQAVAQKHTSYPAATT